MLDGARFAADLGQSFGPLSEREVDYLTATGMGAQLPTTSCGGAPSWACT